MNILIIDDGLGLPEKASLPSPAEEVFESLAAENFRRHLAFAKEISEMGDNALVIRAVPELMKEDAGIFEFREEEGVSHLIIRVGESRRGARLPFKGYLDFYNLLTSNAAGITGLFKPDAVIAGSLLPFGVFAGAKMARLGGCVLITELPCSPAELLRKLRLASPVSAVFPVLKKAVNAAFEKSDAVVGLYPEFFREFTGQRNALQMLVPAPPEPNSRSEDAKLLKASLEAAAEGEVFTLCFCGEVRKGLHLEELIKSAAGFDKKLSVLIIGGGNYKTTLRRIARESGATNVTFCDGIPREDIPFALSAAGGIFASENDMLKGLAFEHGEFFRALLAGRPVLAAAEKNAEFFRRCGGAVLASPPSAENIAAAIKELTAAKEGERELMGFRGKSFAKLHLPDSFSKAYRTAIDNFVKQKEI